MKKQYLIGILGLAAISVPLENTFLETNSSNSSININKLQKTSEDEYFNYSIEQISMGDAHGAAVINDGTEDGDSLYMWGNNKFRQLGLGEDAKIFYNTPQKVTGLPDGNIEQISMGGAHSSAIVDGDLYTWGSNKFGQLGHGDNTNYDSPKEVTALSNSNIEQISMGGLHSSAVADGDLYTWGYDGYEQLGNGENQEGEDEYCNIPQPIEELNNEGNIDQISMGGIHSSAVVDGILYTWGENTYGQLGIGENSKDSQFGIGNNTNNSINCYSTPQEVTELNDKGNIEQISMGAIHSSAVVNNDETDELYTWGGNFSNQLGYENSTANHITWTPQKVIFYNEEEEPINKEIEQISMGGVHSSAILEGDLYTWGNKSTLGYEKNDNDLPQEVTELNNKGNIEQISMGGKFGSAIVEGKLYTWGNNKSGQLGLGDRKPSAHIIPEEIETNFPYFTNNWDSSVDTSNPKQIEISYKFKTNLEVVDVTTNLVPNEDNIPYSSKPDATAKEFYEGTQIISTSEIIKGKEYSYSLDLNYKDASGNDQVLKDFSSGTFNLAALEQEPEITAENVIKDKDDPQHKASVDYTVTEGGTDPDGNVLTLVEVVWMDLNADGQGNDKQLASSKENDKPDALTGTLTCEDLKPNKNYENTVLIAKYKEGDSEWDAQDRVDSFQMDSAWTSTTITLAEIDPNKTRRRRATIDYEINLGKNANEDNTQITSIKWIDNDSSDTLATSKKNSAKGHLTAKGLTPDTSYNNTTLVVELDEGEVDPKAVDGELTTKSAAKDTTAKITKQPEEGEITETSASVSYEVDRGRDSHGGPKYTVVNVEWIDLSNGDVLASSSDSSGTLIAEGLAKGTTYNTELKITMNGGDDLDNLEVHKFTTDLLATDLNEIPTMTNEEVILLSSTSASIEYAVEKGNSPYEVTKVQWMNGDQELASSTKDFGTLIATSLTEDTTYDKTTLVLTYGETGTITNDITPFITEISTTKNIITWKNIALIITGIIILITLFSGILVWLSKRKKLTIK